MLGFLKHIFVTAPAAYFCNSYYKSALLKWYWLCGSILLIT